MAKSKRAAGGYARAAKLSPEQRKESAKKAALARNQNRNLPKATHGSASNPLIIGDVSIPCYVLEDGTRVLSQRGLMTGLGLSYGSASASSGSSRMAMFLKSPFIKSQPGGGNLINAMEEVLKFRPPHGGRPAYGYRATILPDICEAVLAARQAGSLPDFYQPIADQCEILVRGFARVGIIALIDEATGYQKDRERDALAKILEAFVAEELQPYVRTFPPEYYEELFRLRGLDYPPENPRFRPQYFGLLTNDIVYERLAPGLLEELKRQAAKDEKRAHLHRRLTQEVGHPKLREHLASVTTIMKLSKDYSDFIEKLNGIHPRFNDTLSLSLKEEDR